MSTTRRHFLRVLVGATAAGALAPITARPGWAADDPFLYFPHDPLVTYFSSTFGAARSGGRRHQGNDLMAPKLTPVYAAAAGVVTIVSDGPTSGRYLVVEHEEIWSTWYMHLNNDERGADRGRVDWSLTLAPGIEVGSSVAGGQHVAYSGDSGNAEGTGAHTHFELHRNGRAVNPFRHLVDAYDRAVADLAAQETAAQVDALCHPVVGGPQVDGEVCVLPVGPQPDPVIGLPATS